MTVALLSGRNLGHRERHTHRENARRGLELCFYKPRNYLLI